MKLLKDLKEGSNVSDIYYVKQKNSAVTKNGKCYYNVIVQDKSGQMDAKVWDPNGPGIEDFDTGDYVDIVGDVVVFNGATQMRITRARIAHEGEYVTADYVPCSEYDVEAMYAEIIQMIERTKNEYLKSLLNKLFLEDEEFAAKIKFSSAAKSVHHGFVGGLVEHTLSVAKLCEFYAMQYKSLNRDLLVTAALIHDLGKVRELAPYPINDYSDDGNLLGHIVMGVELIGEKIKEIPGFPHVLESELKHCILSHHGEYEYGSPKKPAIIEAVALNFADNLDAKMETFKEAIASTESLDWMGFNRMLDSNIRITNVE